MAMEYKNCTLKIIRFDEDLMKENSYCLEDLAFSIQVHQYNGLNFRSKRKIRQNSSTTEEDCENFSMSGNDSSS